MMFCCSSGVMRMTVSSHFRAHIIWCKIIKSFKNDKGHVLINYVVNRVKRTNFRVYLFSRVEKNRISRVFIFANGLF